MDHEFAESGLQKEDQPELDEIKENDNFMEKSQFMRQNSQMRQGEITLQKIRINKKLKNKKAVALDVLRMLNDIEGNSKGGTFGEFREKKFGSEQKSNYQKSQLQSIKEELEPETVKNADSRNIHNLTVSMKDLMPPIPVQSHRNTARGRANGIPSIEAKIITKESELTQLEKF